MEFLELIILIIIGFALFVILYRIISFELFLSVVLAQYIKCIIKIRNFICRTKPGISGLNLAHSIVLFKTLGILCFTSIRDKLYIFCGGHVPKLELIKINNRKFYILDYYHNLSNYKVIWPTKFVGMNITISAKDNNGCDILDIIKPYMGPDERFHGGFLSPKILGFKEITFENIFREKRKFSDTQTILLDSGT